MERDDQGWLFRAIEYIDFAPEILLYETMAIGQASKGGIGYQDLREMLFDDYGEVIKITKEVLEQKEDGQQ